MKPYYQDDAVTLYHGDARLLLPDLPTADHVITDVPFAQRTHAGARSGQRGSEVPIDFTAWSDSEFTSMGILMLACSHRWIVVSCDVRHAVVAEMAGLPVVRIGAWIKPNAMPQMTGDRPGTGWEAILIMHPDKPKRWNGGGKPAVWTCGTSRWGNFGPSFHPTEKPVPLLGQLIADFTDVGDMILDPFCGSGSTLRAAKDARRRAVGIEIEERYCEIAAKRCSQEVLQFGSAECAAPPA